ncbi:hypothetical protein ACKVV1_011412 [Pyricularia oryzae]
MFPLVPKQSLSFCSDTTAVADFFNGLYRIVHRTQIVLLVIMPIIASLACILMAVLEARRYYNQKKLAQKMLDGEYDAMDALYQGSRPLSSALGLWIGSKLKRSDREYLARWAWAYVTSAPALFVFWLAVAGMLSCLCQPILLRLVKNEAPVLINRVGDFAKDVVSTLDEVLTRWTTDANEVLVKHTNEINTKLLSNVKTATLAVSNTLSTFQTEMNKRLDDVFKGTVLHKVVKDVVRCLLGLKIEAVENGIKWRIFSVSNLTSVQQLAYLTLLKKHHLVSVPYENLQAHYSWHKGLGVSPTRLFEKIVRQRRGGWCFETNQLLNTVLLSLGFDVILAGSRVFEPFNNRFGGLMHCVNIVNIGGVHYLLDVGFGGYGPPQPVPLLEGTEAIEPSGLPHIWPRAEMLVVKQAIAQQADQTRRLCVYQFRSGPDKEWQPICCFNSDFEVLPEDIAWYESNMFYIT